MASRRKTGITALVERLVRDRDSVLRSIGHEESVERREEFQAAIRAFVLDCSEGMVQEAIQIELRRQFGLPADDPSEDPGD